MGQLDVENFREWLSRKYKTENVINTRISNCKRIERYEGSLDNHFDKDGGKHLMTTLTFSRKDNMPSHKIPIEGDLYTGTANHKKSAKLYFAFRESSKK